MTSVAANPPLDEIVALAERNLCFPGSEDSAVKVEVTRQGSIQIEMSLSGSRRWYGWTGSGLAELLPSDDHKLPIADWLKDDKVKRQVRVLAYRPGKRVTLLDMSGHKPHIIKGFRKGRLEAMVDRYELAHSALSGGGVNAPEVIEYDEDMQSLMLTCQEGEPLQLISENMELFQLAGESLRAFQDFASPVKYASFDAREELAVIEARASRVSAAGAAPLERLAVTVERLTSVLGQLPEPRYGLAHRDLHDKQFLQQPSSLALLDFDLLTRADSALDPANFLAHLVLRQMQGARGATQSSIDRCGKKFLRGMDRVTEPGFWRRLRYYQATTFARLALVYRVRPRWMHLADDLLHMSHRCMDDFDRIKEG